MSLLDTASLIVTPNGYKEGKLYSVIPSDGSGDMSVVRATTATRVNSAGLVELVPYNRFQYSEDFTNAIWSKVNTTITSGQTDPFGTSNASRYLNTANGGFILQSGGLVVNEVQTISAWVKSNTGSSQTFIFMANSGVEQSPTLTATNQWQRVTWTFTSSANNNVILFYNPSASLDLLIYGTQLVEGSTAKDYQKTETRLNIPRLDYSNGTCPSLLVEPQRTNITTYSEQFDNAGWSKYIGSVTANATTSPNGTTTADKFIDSTDNDIHAIYKAYTISGDTTFSIYVKAAEYSKIAFTNLSDSGTAKFDLSNGTIISTAANWKNSTIESINNGWYRISSTTNGVSGAKAIGTSLLNSSNQEVFVGTGTSGIFLWGAQVEAGSYATSYIPTTSASVTRNADVISKTGISSLIGQTEGTMFVDAYIDIQNEEASPVVGLFVLNNNASNTDNSIWIGIDRPASGTSNQIYSVVNNGGSNQVIINSSNITAGRHKIAFAYKANDFVLYVNGVLIGSDTSGSVPTLSQALIGSRYNGDTYFLGDEVNAAALWKTRLTNDQLAQLTTI